MSDEGGLLIISPTGDVETPRRLNLQQNGDLTERFLQELIFENPGLIPFSSIDPTMTSAAPICMELNTAVGRLDILLVSERGRLICVETKLWRNPQARREVVAQVVDYASELSTWDYEGIDSAVRRRREKSLFECARDTYPDLSEAEFCDNVSKSLREGRIQLIICGDGIREGTANIANFLNRTSSLQFSLGVVEYSFFIDSADRKIVQTRILAKTEIIRREVFVSDNADVVVEMSSTEEPDTRDDAEMQERRDFWLDYWQAVKTGLIGTTLSHLVFEPQRRFRAAGVFNARFVYLLVYFDRSAGRLGVSLSINSDAREFYEHLLVRREDIEAEFGAPLAWRSLKNGRFSIGCQRDYLDPRSPEGRATSIDWFVEMIPKFDHVFGNDVELWKQE